jgi:hypothetical protein
MAVIYSVEHKDQRRTWHANVRPAMAEARRASVLELSPTTVRQHELKEMPRRMLAAALLNGEGLGHEEILATFVEGRRQGSQD